ncbi:MAG: AmmeMemoRadiSam system protein B [Calditrichaeota bacterium]|nr:AmmeMemoRadiSam system protein B [Calditrichota bacterium]
MLHISPEKALILIFAFALFFNCSKKEEKTQTSRQIRGLVDTVGFAHLGWQMDSVMQRIDRLQKDELKKALERGKITQQTSWKVAVSPHDDYGYVGYLYPAVHRNIKAKTVILFGVAHKARLLKLENQIIFDTYPYWHGPYGPIGASPVREEIIRQLPQNYYQVNDSMQTIEHSVEALIPFLQYFRKDREIVSVLVPYMPFERMREIAKPLAAAIAKVVRQNNWQWGKDFAIVISNDAVHYGDEGWGDKNFAFYGTDEAGYKKAVEHEREIINQCLSGKLSEERIRKFTEYTVSADDFKQYKWTWCGRYSVPMGLLTAYYLSEILEQPLKGRFIGYANSIDHAPLPVKDLRMGFTAPANMHHWVGYVAMGWE